MEAAQKDTVNQLKDWLERTAWTFINTMLGLLTADQLIGSIDIDLWHKLEAAALAALFTTIKVALAQQGGTHNDGAAIPGGIMKEGK